MGIEGKRSYCLMVTEFLIGMMKKAWKWIVVSYTTLSIYLMPLNYILKVNLNTNLCYIYYHNKKKKRNFIAVLFMLVQTWKAQVFISRRVDEQANCDIGQYYSAWKWNKILMKNLKICWVKAAFHKRLYDSIYMK